MTRILDDAAQDHLLEAARERLARYREMQAERFLGDGWPAIPVLEPVRVKVDLGPAERLKACPECGEPDRRYHGCPAKQ